MTSNTLDQHHFLPDHLDHMFATKIPKQSTATNVMMQMDAVLTEVTKNFET